MVEVKPFSGIMNSDSPLEKVNPLHHIMAFNVVFRGEAGNLRVENVVGNRIVANTYLPTVAVCPVITNLKTIVKYHTISYSFSASNAAVTNYTVNLRNFATNAIVTTQTITNTYGSFTSIAEGTYYIEVIVHCTNSVDSTAITSSSLTVAALTCAAVTGLNVSASYVTGQGYVDYDFSGSVDDVTTYTVKLMQGVTIISTQTISTTFGQFALVPNGDYTVTVTPNCANGLTGGTVTSSTVTVAIPANIYFSLVPDVETGGSGDALLVRCQQAGVDTPAPFTTSLTVHYFRTVGGGSPVEITQPSIILSVHATVVYIDGTTGASFSGYEITDATPANDGTNVYLF